MRRTDEVGLIIMVLRFIIEAVCRCGKACVKPFSSESDFDEDEDNNQPNS